MNDNNEKLDIWKAVYDPNYDQYYYYNPSSDTVTWVLPKGAVVSQWIKPNATPRDDVQSSNLSNTTNDDYSESDGPVNMNSNNSGSNNSNNNNNKKKKKGFKKKERRSRLPIPKSRRMSESSAENTPDLEVNGRAKTSSADNTPNLEVNGRAKTSSADNKVKRVPMRKQKRHRNARISSDDRPPNAILVTPNQELSNKSSSDSKEDNHNKSKEKYPSQTNYEEDDEKNGELLMHHSSEDKPVVVVSSKKTKTRTKMKKKIERISGDSLEKVKISSSKHEDELEEKYDKVRISPVGDKFDKIVVPPDNKSESNISSSFNSDGEVVTPSFEVEPGSPEHEEFDKHATVALDVLMGKNIQNISTEKNIQNDNNNNNNNNNESQMLRNNDLSARRRTATMVIDHEVGVHLLATGQTFFKYGNHSKPHLKFVSVDLQGNLTYVDALTQKKKPDTKGFHFSNVISILQGKQTKVFKQRGKNADEKLCFSLVVKNRTLDLQAPTTAVRDTWVNVLRVYHARYNQQQPQPVKLVSIKSDPNIVAPPLNKNKKNSKNIKSATPQKKAAFKPKLKKNKDKRPLTKEEKEKFQQMYRRVSVNRDQSMSLQPRSSRKALSPDVHMVMNSLAGGNLPGRLKRSASEQK